LGDKLNGEYHTFLAVSIKATITPHQLEKIRQNGYPLFTNWKIGISQDPLPTRFKGLSFLLDQIDNYVNNKLIEKKVRERRGDLVDGWMGILELDKEIKGEAAFHVEYSSWELQQNNYVVVVKIKGDKNLEDFIAPDQILMMSTNQDRKIQVGHFLKQDGNTIYLSRLSDADMSAVAKNGLITTDERQWAAAWSRQRNALITIINGMCVNPKLPDILLDPRQASFQLQVDIEKIFTPELDRYKKEVVAQAIGAKDVYLIQGPPGTGKTVVITEIIAQILANKPKARILLVSQSNVAVDHVLKKVGNLLPNTLVVRIGKEDLISHETSEYQIDKKVRDWSLKTQAKSKEFVKLHTKKSPERQTMEFSLDIANELISSISRAKDQTALSLSEVDKEASLHILQDEYPTLKIAYDVKLLGELHSHISARLDGLKSPIELTLQEWANRLDHIDDFENDYLQSCSIVAGTCVGIVGRKKLPERFDLTIVDEAGRATPSELLISLVRSEKCILVGDHKQLPPVFDFELKKQVEDKDDIDPIWLEQSLFEYLFRNLDEKLKSTLKLQYRMHPSIANLIGNVFYKDEGLETGILSTERLHQWSRWSDAIVWCSTSQLYSRGEGTTSDGSKYNLSEVKIILTELKYLENELSQSGQRKSVAIISGYSAQVEQLKNQIEPQNDKKWKYLSIEINTVDAFQGKEEDIVFYSVVRSNKSMEIGFLGDFRRLNVALSRGSMSNTV
jgi:serine/threonine-protein kinase